MNEKEMYYMPPYPNMNQPPVNPFVLQEEINRLKREIRRLDQRIINLEKTPENQYKNNYNYDDGMYMV